MASFPIYTCYSSTNTNHFRKVSQPVKVRQKRPAGLVWARKGGKPLCCCILHSGKRGGNTSSGKGITPHSHTHHPLALFLHSSYPSILIFYVSLHPSFLPCFWLQSPPPLSPPWYPLNLPIILHFLLLNNNTPWPHLIHPFDSPPTTLLFPCLFL